MAKIIKLGKRTKFPVNGTCWRCRTEFSLEKTDLKYVDLSSENVFHGLFFKCSECGSINNVDVDPVTEDEIREKIQKE